ncbi:isoaspartyl peptidase/L-asparaginase family protein [Rheinheimera tangshanensis]|uniref:Isoaspartyl peptidase n=1 Tax=Rheinheimera tangshanensis TaxID=400153 RepID=A0A5C8LVU9_9GAMM|nr:isoaspartyl peptidase/L-asparaginase [Rheinheimera tangshanensis]TXK80817.1 isoaspartyl peptidase/L-asparaginase [Rheinheimera tangshanensis]GGM63014.1 isoaspartyl peptidase/L-asparaginase [Rheinheimera tangshanensis]
MRRTMSFLALSCFSAMAFAKQPLAIVIHGGAGTINKSQMTDAQEQAYHATLKHAVDTGYAVLEKGGSSVDAVTAAVLIMEDSPLFNAGKGAVYTYDEGHELDASIMRGDNLMAGAASGLKHVKNPVLLARAVMEKSEHVMLSGAGAEQFAKEQGLQLVENSYFDTSFRYDALKKAKQSMQKVPHQAKNYRLEAPWQPEWNMGTVGAVAIDSSGLLTAATSTGGMTAKRYGRIGDAPIIGAGNFADNASCAVSATGHGEFFIRYRVASDICARVKYQGISADKAADQVIQHELAKVGGTGGVILIDHKGKVSWSFNTEGMYRAKRSEGEAAVTEIFKQSSAK